MKKLEIKINHEPISTTIPFAWEVELLTETNHIDKIQECSGTTEYNNKKELESQRR